MTVEKKYRVIAKLSRIKSSTGQDKCGKWTANDLIAFTAFLDKNYPDWCWFNVYRYTGNDSGKQLASFSKYNRPLTKRL